MPVLFLDLQSLEKNIDWIAKNAGEKKIRLATKSIRSVEVMKIILRASEVFQGLMTYDLREALWLRSLGFRDILMGYPSIDGKSLEELSQTPEGITLMVDLPEHLDLINSYAMRSGNRIKICIDIDLSMDLPGVRFGVYRSHLNTVQRVMKFVNHLKQCPYLELKGLMGYEAQIAGVTDKNSLLIRGLKKISLFQLQKRREEIVSYLNSEGFSLNFVNGGGTGSLTETSKEKCVTEVTVGSGFFSPVLFDHYQDFNLTPALLFTLPILRKPEQGILTCFGGGYIASGAVEMIKQPHPYLPHGLKLLKHEGAGEVQTPLQYDGEVSLNVGDSVIMRHAKSGEVCERFDEIKIISHGRIESKVFTYRGEGKTFI